MYFGNHPSDFDWFKKASIGTNKWSLKAKRISWKCSRLADNTYIRQKGEKVQRQLHHGESKEAEGVQAEHCHHRCVLLQKIGNAWLKITLTLSVGPLGDQIVRGEMAAPTGRSKDRTRMDEDEVSSSRLNFCNGASILKCSLLSSNMCLNDETLSFSS